MNPNRAIRSKSRVRKFLIFLSIALIVILFSIEIYFNTSVYNHLENKAIKKFQDLFPNHIAEGLMYISFILNHELVMFFFIILVFNLCNIYKTFMLMTMISFSYYLAGLTKMLYLSQRPYFYNNLFSIDVYSCELGWGFLSSTILTMVVFYFSLWKVFNESSHLLPKWIKYLCLAIVIVITVFLSFFFLLNGTNYLYQIVSSYVIGLCIYVLIFEGININLNDGNQFHYYIIHQHILVYVIIYLCLCGIYLLPYYFRSYKATNPISLCNGVIHSYIKHKPMEAKNIIQQYQNENIAYLGYFLGNFFSILGIKMELNITFKKAINNWLQFNFAKRDDDNNELESLLGSISITRDTKWNNTNTVKSFIRLFVLLGIGVIAIIPYLVLYNQWDNNVYLLFFFKMLLSSSLLLFSMFYLSKLLLRKMNLINMTQMIIQDPINDWVIR